MWTLPSCAQFKGKTVDGFAGTLGSHVEEYMGEPFPSTFVAILYENAVSGAFAGTNFGTHIAILPKYDVDGSSYEAESAISVIAHEVAHYYWSGNAGWV